LTPDLIMLDLNLPGISGQEVLKTIKGDEKLKSIPVVVLTTSKAEEDITKAYKHHANCYVTKPVGYDKLADLVYSIETFWLGIVSLPRGEK
jgi:CheY-like chemotaxis protein